MLIALDKDNVRIQSNLAIKNAEYRCPSCGYSVILKRGTKKISHYAHTAFSECTYGQGETSAHFNAKIQLRDWLVKQGIKAELEFWLGCNRPDVLAFNSSGDPIIAFEIQKSNLTNDDLYCRTAKYADLGIPV